MHHIWACDHYKTTLNADKFKQTYKKRTDKVKDAMSAVPYGDRKAMVDAILAAIKAGGLFAVDVDIVPTKIGQACHVWLPAATAGEMNLTSMNGERRLRLTERYMDPPGQSMPDCLIAARLANNLERVFREMGHTDLADKFKGFDWKTEEDAFMDGYHGNAKGGEFVAYERLRAMGNNGVQEPATGFENGKLIGTKRLFADGKFGTKDGKATFMATQWRGLPAPGKEEESKKFAFLINNGRANHVWQSLYLDQQSDFVMDRWPIPYIQMNPDDMQELGVSAGDLVEVYNDNGATQAMAYPTPTARRKQTFMLFAHPMGVQGNVVSRGVNELIIPNYKQTWGNIRKIASAPGAARATSFKSGNSGSSKRPGSESARASQRPSPQSFQRAASHRKRMRTNMADQPSVGTRGSSTLTDPFGRAITYVRVSVTDRCDFRCAYCMAEEMTFLPRRELLTLEELDRLCSAFIEMGTRRNSNYRRRAPRAAATSRNCSARSPGISSRERFKRSP